MPPRVVNGRVYLANSYAKDVAVYGLLLGSMASDYDHDGKADAAVYDPSTGYEFTLSSNGDGNYTAWTSNPLQLVPAQGAQNYDKFLTADFSGDGKGDLF